MKSVDGLEEPLTDAALRQRVAELSRVQRIGRIGGFEIDLRDGQFFNQRSPEYLSVHGVTTDAAREAHEAWVQRVHPEDRGRAETHFKNCVAGDARHYSSEYRIVLPGKGVRWISAIAEIDRDEAGAPLRMIGVHIDITRTKEAEEALRASELALKESEQRLRDLNAGLEKLADERARQLASSRAQLQAFFDNSPDWLTLQRCTPDGRFIYVDINPTCEEAYGLPRSRVIGRRVEEILGEEGAQITLAHFRECVRTGKPQRYVTHRTMAGITRFIDVISALVPGAHDRGDRFLLTSARDLTDHQRLETQLRQAQKMDAIGQLTGGVAHDFNNLLTIVLGNATLLKKGIAKDPTKLVDNILLAGERGSALTRQLLSLARNRPLTRQVIDLTAHVPKMTEMLRSSLRGDINLRISVDPNAGAIEADIGELEIALLNVAVNARDAMPTGGQFIIDVREVESGSPPVELPPAQYGYVAIAAQDNGMGMPADVITRAFEPFFTTKMLGSGTGLGLSQVFGFAKSSGGIAHIASQPGEGTCVTIILPVTGKKDHSASSVDGDRSLRRLSGRVLLVDDNEEVITVTKAMISAMGLEVETAASAAEALERLAAGLVRFDLMLTDVVMPDMSGVDLVRVVHRLHAELPIILMSGYNDASTANEYHILRKPVPYDKLHEVIQASLKSAY
ncbi:PAS domain-containing sensor histidine kinase [Acidisphaera sp. S103]|uniref:hybrid sensor histidine kinase/response regulator n=1 Tax=Acidisphaera sp. S103 TaxID=1747223 RepID=UPI00131DCB6D|nr:PAS domain-containing protein [Acidisphaera sp. S103]